MQELAFDDVKGESCFLVVLKHPSLESIAVVCGKHIMVSRLQSYRGIESTGMWRG